MAQALDRIKLQYKKHECIEARDTEWLIEHCTDFMNELHKIENAVRYVFNEEPIEVNNESRN